MPNSNSSKTKPLRASRSLQPVVRVLAAHRIFGGFAYSMRIIKRQSKFLLVFLCAYVPLVILLSRWSTPIYRAQVSALYTPHDEQAQSNTPSREAHKLSDPHFRQIALSLQRQLASEDFLVEVVRSPELNESLSDSTGLLSQYWAELIHFLGITTGDELSRQQKIAYDLRSRLHAHADADLRLLQISATAANPKLAKQLAELVMEHFLKSELRLEAQLAQIEFEYLRRLSVQKTVRNLQTNSSKIRPNSEQALSNQDTPATVLPEKSESLQQSLEDLENRIQRLRTTITSEQSALDRRRQQLESEISRLSVQLTASHPDLIAKEEELSQLPRTADTSDLEQKLLEAMKQQSRLRNELNQISSGLIPHSRVAEPKPFTDDLDARLDHAEQTYLRLRDQASTPALRTRLRSLGGATLDPKSGQQRREKAIFLIMLGLFATPVLLVLREGQSGQALDIWRIQQRTAAPVLWAADRSMVDHYAHLDRSALYELRLAATKTKQLRSLHENRDAAALRLMRHAAHLLGSGLDSEARPTLLLTASSDDRSGGCLMSVLNIYADERPGKTLVIDLAHRDPLCTVPAATAKQANIAGFLVGKTPWQLVRQNADAHRAFAWVPPMPEEAMADGSVRYLQASTLKALIATLAKSYQHIFVRALPSDQPSANDELIACAGRVLIVCDARSTKLVELDHSLAIVPADKLGGLIVVAS